MRLWDVDSGQEVRRFEGHTGQVLAVAFSPDGRLLAFAGYNPYDLDGKAPGPVEVWDVRSGQRRRQGLPQVRTQPVPEETTTRRFPAGSGPGSAVPLRVILNFCDPIAPRSATTSR